MVTTGDTTQPWLFCQKGSNSKAQDHTGIYKKKIIIKKIIQCFSQKDKQERVQKLASCGKVIDAAVGLTTTTATKQIVKYNTDAEEKN